MILHRADGLVIGVDGVSVPHDCWLCPDIIEPSKDKELVVVGIPDRGRTIRFHVECYEQFTMTLSYFWVNNLDEIQEHTKNRAPN